MPDPKPLPIASVVGVRRDRGALDQTTLLFDMRAENTTHSLDMKSVLKCVRHAEEQETLPALPLRWWVEIWKLYGEKS